MNGVLSWLVRWAQCAGTRDFCPAFAALVSPVLTIYAPMIYTAFDAGSIHYLGTWEGGWALEIEIFMGPVKCHPANMRVHLGLKKIEISRARPPPAYPCNRCCPHQKHYTRGLVNHRCIGGFMYKSPPWRGLRVHTLRVHIYMLARDRPRRWRAHEGDFWFHTVGVGGAAA